MSTMHQRAVELERQLAIAQGHDVAFIAASGTVWVIRTGGALDWLPRPAREVADCMNLMMEVGVWPRERQGAGGNTVFEVVDADGQVCHAEAVNHRDDRKACFLMAAVAGAIAVLSKRTSA